MPRRTFCLTGTHRLLQICGLLVAATLLQVCARPPAPQPILFAADAFPERLSQWQLLTHTGKSLQLHNGVVPYEVNVPLFSDYAAKLRTVWIPPGTTIGVDAERFIYPVGTILSKTFFYDAAATGPTAAVQQVTRSNHWRAVGQTLDLADRHLVETRLMVRYDSGWQAVSYRWRGSDAYLAVTGGVERLNLAGTTFAYIIPSRNECAACHASNHTTGALLPIGAHPNQLHGASPLNPDLSQQEHWVAAGRLTKADYQTASQITPWPMWQTTLPDNAHALTALARAYLAANCAHCHNPQGPADTSALNLEFQAPISRALGVCKAPIAAGRGTGGRLYSIVPGHADQSILSYRLASTDIGSRMPETGRSLTHVEGVTLVNGWINSLPGDCR